MIVRRKHLRIAGLAVLGWIVAETLLFSAAISRFGVFVSLSFMALKGFGGLALLAISLRSVLRDAARSGRRGLSSAAGALFSALGAFLIFLPGFLAPLAGLALFSPSVRALVIRRLRGEKRRSRHGHIIALDRSEWREVSVRRPRRSRRTKSLAP